MSFAVKSKEKLKNYNISIVEQKDKVTIYKACFEFEKDVKAGKITLEIEFPMLNILSVYSPVLREKRSIYQWFQLTKVDAEFCYNSPFLSTVVDDKNYVTIAISDAINATNLSVAVRDFDEKEKIRFTIVLLNKLELKNKYEVYIRVDERDCLLTKTISDLVKWQQTFYRAKNYFNSDSENAVYSTWYNFHQHPNAEKLEKELKMASQMGLKTVIVDDGWQYDGNGTGDYIDCGDWAFSKEKFSDFKGFVDKIHSFDIKVMLWFPVPYVGFNTNAYKKFKDKLLYETRDNINAGILDIRYKEVREHIINTLFDIVKTKGIDGLKLDFVDNFIAKKDTPKFNNEMDIDSVPDAVTILLEELNEKLFSYNKNFLIEYRQDYVGPAIVRFGNMLRVADCAFDSNINRTGIADLRMFNYNLAVHSDMLYWAKDEKVENVVRQLYSVMFSVPQISVLLTEVPKEHNMAIKSFIEYWTNNRDILLHGEFVIKGNNYQYPQLIARSKNKDICVLYRNEICYCDNTNTDIINSSSSNEICVVNNSGANIGQVFDYFGNKIDEVKITSGVNLLSVPIGYRVEIR